MHVSDIYVYIFTEPLTIIRQGPGQVRTIIPVTIGSKITTSSGITGSTTAGQMAIISAQSQKVAGIQQATGSKIRIVAPNTSTSSSTGTKVSSLAALQNLSEGKKIISHSPAFSGGSTIVKKVIPKTQPLIKDMKTILLPTTTSMSAAFEASKEPLAESKLDSKIETSVPTSTVATVNKEMSWNLPPIDMKALKLPQQLSSVRSIDNKKIEPNLSSPKTKGVNKSVKPDAGMSQSQDELSKRQGKPKFNLTGSPSDSNQSGSQSPVTDMMSTGSTLAAMSQTGMLSTRPSDIDLHEMRLSSNQNSTPQMMPTRHESQQQADWLETLGNQSYSSSNNQNQSGNPQNVGFQQPIPRLPKNTSSQSSGGIFNPGLPNMTGTNEMKQISNASALGQAPQTSTHGQVFSNNQTSQSIYGDFGGTGFMNTQGSGRNAARSSFGTPNSTFQDQSSSFGNQNSGFNSGNSGNDNMADFTMSGIHNNSSFLSELTDADDNFLSQLDAAGSDQNSQTSMDGSQMVNPAASTQSGSMASSSSLGMPTYPQGGMNFDMFSNPQQQNQNFFPNFNSNNQFGSQQNMNMSQQGGFPGGPMYPMGGVMQPSMFPYPAFAPYPYAPMMAPMPYYPVPFQPQYGGQGANMGQQTGNIGQQGTSMGQPGASMGKPMSEQGDSSFQSGMGNL